MLAKVTGLVSVYGTIGTISIGPPSAAAPVREFYWRP